MSEAISLYRSDFLAGFTLSGCPDFDDWQFFQTEGYRQLFATALEQMIALLAESGRWNEAVSPAR